MAGHSKWKNIMHKKEKTDAQRAKLFTKIGREISLIVKEGGTDPNSNSRLRDVIAKAKANNVPNDNIERIIKKASSTDDSNYEEIVYEGYGPSGVAVIVEALTDNRNRTAASMRHYFDKYGGNLGQSGSVAWQFEKKGIVIVEKNGVDEDILMEKAIEGGAEDFSTQDDVYEIQTAPENLQAVNEALEKDNYKILNSDMDMIPSAYITLTNEDDISNMIKLLEMLEDDDDVQNVYHNWENTEE